MQSNKQDANVLYEPVSDSHSLAVRVQTTPLADQLSHVTN